MLRSERRPAISAAVSGSRWRSTSAVTWSPAASSICGRRSRWSIEAISARSGAVLKAAFGDKARQMPEPGSASEDYSEFVIAGVPSFHALGRAAFDALIEAAVKRSIDISVRVLADAGMKAGEIHGALLVGGSTRVPLVRSAVAGMIGKPPLTDIDPDEVVALASSRSVGKQASFGDNGVLKVHDLAKFDFKGIDIVLSSPGAKVSAEHSPRAAKAGAVTEAGNLTDGTIVAGTSSVTGALSVSDVDANSTQAWSIVGTASTTYGTFTVNATTGAWSYVLDNTLAATQALKEGEVVTLVECRTPVKDEG